MGRLSDNGWFDVLFPPLKSLTYSVQGGSVRYNIVEGGQ